MKVARGTVLACLWLSAGSPAVAQVAPWTGSTQIQGTRTQGSSGVVTPRVIVPSLPRWGGGPPPPSPFDRPLPGAHSAWLSRPGKDAFRAGPETYAPRFSPDSTGKDGRRDGRRDGRHDNDGRRDGRRRHGRSDAFVYPTLGAVYYSASPYYPYGYPSAYPAVVAAPFPQVPAPAPREEPEGFLRLLITPRNARVFIDGAYAGTVDDFGGTGERALPAGLHTVRVEADGFEPVEFDVRVPVNDTMTFRRDLEPLRQAPPPPVAPPQAAAPPSPKTIYVIPRCYLGDSRPQQSQLPPGCSLADLRTLN